MYNLCELGRITKYIFQLSAALAAYSVEHFRFPWEQRKIMQSQLQIQIPIKLRMRIKILKLLKILLPVSALKLSG